MRRLSPSELLLSLVGALCAVAFVAMWLARDARAVDAVPSPLGLVEAADVDALVAAADGAHVVLQSRSEPPIAERRAVAASDPQSLLERHPDRSQLDFVVSAFGAPAAGAVIVLFGSSDLAPPLFVAASGLTLTDAGGVVTGLDGHARVAVAPKLEWRGIVRWTPPAPGARLSAEFRAVSPSAGYPRVIAIDLGAPQAARFLHVEVCSVPSAFKLCGAELVAILDDGTPAPSEIGPTRAVSGADGRALIWWPMGTRLCVDAEGHTPLEVPAAYFERLRAGAVHTTLEAASAAAPTPLELSALGALHGRLDPRWAAGGRVIVRGPTIGSFGRRQVRYGAASRSSGDSSATVTATGHWRIDGLPTNIASDPARAFAVDLLEGVALWFDGADLGDVPRVVRASLYADIWLDSAADLELLDPFGACAPVALTARSPRDLDLDGGRVQLHLLRLPDGKDVGPRSVRFIRRIGSRRQGITAAPELVAEGLATATGRVVAPDLPLGFYELRVPGLVTFEERFQDLDAEPPVKVARFDAFDVSEHFSRAFGRFEHDGRPVETALTRGPPADDD